MPTVNASRIVAIALIEGSSVVRIWPQTKVESVLPPAERERSDDEIVERDRRGDQRGPDQGSADLRQRHAQKRLPAGRAEVARGLDARHVEARKAGEHHEYHEGLRQQDVGEDYHRPAEPEAEPAHEEHDDCDGNDERRQQHRQRDERQRRAGESRPGVDQREGGEGFR